MIELPKGEASECGPTRVAGYQRHMRAGEAACIKCKAGWRRYWQAYRALGRKTKKGSE